MRSQRVRQRLAPRSCGGKGDAIDDRDLVLKYDVPGPRYTSYPTAVEFGTGYDDRVFLDRLREIDRRTDEPLSLYVHLPFCEERCSYCGCHVVITRKRDIVDRYLQALHGEIDLLARHLSGRRLVSQLHWGGGTPTYLGPDQLAELHARLAERFELVEDGELAIEVDPRKTTRDQLAVLADLGFNRISLGVQDLDPTVQSAIGRGQSAEQTERCYASCRELDFPSVNFDLVYGLPGQTLERFEQTVKRVLTMRPDRLAIYSYAHVPWIRPHQKRIDADLLPDHDTKLELFYSARAILLDAGYRQVGMDHFALPDDELVAAMGDRRLHRNFMGYTVRSGCALLGLGVSAISDLAGSYAQNVKKLPHYYKALDEGRFPVERGYLLDDDDLIRREVITGLMCNFFVDRGRIERRFEIDFADYFAEELATLRTPGGLIQDGIVEIRDDAVLVTERGRSFVRNVCMTFDRHRRDASATSPVFSRTI